MENNHLDLGIVILHYNNLEDTINTVASFQEKLDTENYHIVIVDNASPNNSGQELCRLYEGKNHISVLLSTVNKGFSAGNNIGILHLNNNYDCDYIILSNNDILLYSDELFAKTKELFHATGFAVMGPLIMTGGGRCDANPISDVPYSRQDSEKEIKHFKHILKLNDHGLYKAYKYYDYYMSKFSTRYRLRHQINTKSYNAGLYLQQRENIVLHGCFIIFSKLYFKHFTGLDERTFMYSEENILYRHLAYKGLKMLYCPAIAIYHKEGASVNTSLNKGDESKIFRYKIKIDSHKAYIELLNELGIE